MFVNRSKWRTKEDDYLCRNYTDRLSIPQLARDLHRTEKATYNRCVQLGLTRRKSFKYRYWTEQEERYLREHFTRKPSVKKIAQHLGRTEKATYERCIKLGLTKTQTKRKRWSQEEKDFLRQNYRISTYEELGKKLGRSKSAVNGMIQRLKLPRKR